MRAVVFDEQLRYVSDYPEPIPAPGEALIRVLCAGVCNTDLEIIKGYMGFRGVLGHEFVGVVESAEIKEWIGKRVVGEINCYCEECDFCQNGLEKHCRRRTVLGISGRGGCMAEFLTLPLRNLRMIDSNISDEAAVFTEPVAAACEIFTQIDPRQFERPAVLGSGKLGLLIALVLLKTGTNPLVIGRNREKLHLAEKFGLRVVHIDDLKEKDFDFIVEATGNPEGFNTALALARPRGTIMLKSTYAKKLEFDAAPIVINEIGILGSRCGPFDPALEFLAEYGTLLRPLISGVFPLEQAAKAFDVAARPASLKILLKI